MTDSEILVILKYAGFALAAASAIWGTLKKTTFDDPQGHKRLTPSGYVAIVITLGGAMISAGAFGFETIIKDKAERANAAQLRVDKLEAALQNNQTLISRALDRAEAAELRAAAANQRSISLTIATRQLALANKVGKGAAANLAKADRALYQIGRVLQPTDIIRARIEWKVDQRVTISRFLQERIDLVVSALVSDNALSDIDTSRLRSISPGYDFEKSVPRGAKLVSLAAKQGSFIYPRPNEDGVLFAELDSLNAEIVFFTSKNASTLLTADINQELWFDSDRGDYGFLMPETATKIRYFLPTGGIQVTSEGEGDPSTSIRSGELVAVQDFEQATLVIFLSGVFSVDEVASDQIKTFRTRMQPSFFSLKISGRTYFIVGRQFRKVNMINGTAWIVDKIGKNRQ
jgi:hypothetical protein